MAFFIIEYIVYYWSFYYRPFTGSGEETVFGSVAGWGATTVPSAFMICIGPGSVVWSISLTSGIIIEF
jgi:hypothetical protein